jgi:hypothetical protein
MVFKWHGNQNISWKAFNLEVQMGVDIHLWSVIKEFFVIKKKNVQDIIFWYKKIIWKKREGGGYNLWFPMHHWLIFNIRFITANCIIPHHKPLNRLKQNILLHNQKTEILHISPRHAGHSLCLQLSCRYQSVNWRLDVPHELTKTSEAQLCCLGLESHLIYQEEMLCVESMLQISLYHIPETGNWVVVYIFP